MKKIRLKIMQWFWFMPDRKFINGWENSQHSDAWDKFWTAWDWITLKVAKTFCFFIGHQPERDQCMMPKHDYCFFCHKSMPGQWVKP